MTARHLSSLLVVLLACLSLTTAALAEPSAYLRIKGAKQGDIKGGVTQKGREDSIMVYAVDHTLTSPVDAATGQASGKRQHKPITITKEIDKSTPLLRNALTQNEVLSEVTIQFYAPSAKSGAETNHFTITLRNARIVGIHHVMADNRDTQNAKLDASEHVSFSYESITWTWTDGGISSTDSALAR